jgi:upstream activation factor subunit UAF30
MASIESLQGSLQAMEKVMKSMQRDIRKIRQRLEDPTGEKAKARSENNSFKKPLQVSEKLRTFLNLKEDELISRSEVTKRIAAYAKENGLTAGKKINLDASLKDLLNPPADVEMNFLKIQTYINHHYVKPVAAVNAPVTDTVQKKGKPKVKA